MKFLIFQSGPPIANQLCGVPTNIKQKQFDLKRQIFSMYKKTHMNLHVTIFQTLHKSRVVSFNFQANEWFS